MSAVVELVQISKSFPGVTALQQVDLALQPGRIHALIGENGAGKSTLINLLSGVLRPDHGDIRLAGQPVYFADARMARAHGIITVHQEVDLFPDLTVAENLGFEQGLPANRLGWIRWRLQRQRTQEAFAAVGEHLAPSTLAGTLSPAQRQMTEIAAAVSQAARVLILDEPTSSLSAAESQVLFTHLRRFRTQGVAILYVSHRLEEIFALADEATVLRDGRRVWTGPLADSSPQHLIGQMVGRAAEVVPERESKQLGAVRLRCQSLTAVDRTFQDISLEVRGGEILGLYGLIGAGRTEWAQAVFGLRPLTGGEVRLDGQRVTPQRPGQMVGRGVAYVPEDRLRQGLCRGLSIRANTVLASLRRIACGLWVPRSEEKRRTNETVTQLAVRLRSIEQPAGTLSGGNQQKVVLGRWLGCDPQILLLDEPTRGVDVGAKAEIHALVHRLAAEGRAIVFISSDLPEVLAQSDRVGVFREGRLVALLDPKVATAEEVAAAAIPTGEPEASAPGGSKYPGANAPGSPRSVLPASLTSVLREAGLLLVLLAFCGFLEWRTGGFFNASSFRNLATNTALLGFCALGAMFVILAGGLDISLGALMALSAGVAGRLWQQDYPMPLVVATALCVGAAGGMLNAALSLVGRVHPIVVTLGTMSLYRGLTLWWIKQDVQIPNSARSWMFAERFGVPGIAWSGLAVVVVAWLFLTGTVAGRQLYALGSNPAAAHRVGLHRRRIWLLAFTLQGLLVGLAGLLNLGRSGSMQPTSYEDQTLQAIAAVVVGGVAITGGRGSVWGVVLGCLFLVVLQPACILLHIPTVWQRTLVGGVMLVAVVFDRLWRRREA